tara:strand:- start:5746 stop:6120 length:375 start_codon:yes stop_codon:yes gene_type:complete
MVKESVSSFDLSKYQIAPNTQVVSLKIDGTEDGFDVTIKQLSWSKRNQLVSSCLKWSDSGDTSFDGDKYIRECLKEMIVEAPWGKTTEAFLVSIDERLGTALETLVPQAFSAENKLDPKIVKKE